MDKAATTPLGQRGALRNFVSEVNRKVFEKHTSGSHTSTNGNISGGENDENVPGDVNKRQSMLDAYKSKHRFVPVSPARCSRRQRETVTNFVKPAQVSTPREKHFHQELPFQGTRRQKKNPILTNNNNATSQSDKSKSSNQIEKNQHTKAGDQSSSSALLCAHSQKVRFSVEEEGHLNYTARRRKQQRQGKANLTHEAEFVDLQQQHKTKVETDASSRPSKAHGLNSDSLFRHIHAPVGHSTKPKKYHYPESLRNKPESNFAARLSKPPGLENTETAAIHGNPRQPEPSCGGGWDTDFSVAASILRGRQPRDQTKHVVHESPSETTNRDDTGKKESQRSIKAGESTRTGGVQLSQMLEDKVGCCTHL